jgi:oligopeptidase B
MAIVYKKGMEKDGSNPALLYGYGSYGINTDANFRSNIFSLVDRGFIYAIAQVRGGSEMGEQWYESGKLMNKKNSFNDFIACAENLIKEKYTSSAKLAINGGSAGGLLVGAVTVMRPDLFKVVVADVPFVDVVNTMLDETLPLTTQEYEQWGNPHIEKDYEYMISYSPYDNVKAAAYPNILATTGWNDSQVMYHEPAKWVAKLRAMKTDKNIILLKTNLESGHGGATGRFDYLKEVAYRYAFILDRLGVADR